MRGTQMVWPAIVLMSALSTAGAAQSAGGDGARLPQSPQYPLLPRAEQGSRLVKVRGSTMGRGS
jgi:hypothetical protein